jgi:hypothetical protein
MLNKSHQCVGKQAHEDKAAALRHIRAMKRNGVPGGGGLEPYRCPHCGLFHIGHPQTRSKNPKVRRF